MIKSTSLEHIVDSTTPAIVKCLAYGGLIPFLFLALASWADSKHSLQFRYALQAYGAVILSFVGALHWGFAMSHNAMSQQLKRLSFVWSVIPALIAWIALLVEARFAFALIALGFLLHFWQDWRLVKRLQMPAWYLPMRLRLTVFACLSLLSAYL